MPEHFVRVFLATGWLVVKGGDRGRYKLWFTNAMSPVMKVFVGKRVLLIPKPVLDSLQPVVVKAAFLHFANSCPIIFAATEPSVALVVTEEHFYT